MGEILDPFSAIMVPSFNKEKCEELVEDIFNIRIDQKNRSKKIAVVGIGFSYIETNRSTQKNASSGTLFLFIDCFKATKEKEYVCDHIVLSSILNHSCLRINGELDG